MRNIKISVKNMNFSRSHILMLAAISLFTGMIAPAAAGAEIVRPYAMTNMQYVAFAILFSLSGLFLSTNLGFRKLSSVLIGTLLTLVISLFVLTITGFVKSNSGIILQSLSWGWIFLAIGIFFLFVPLFFELDENSNELTIFYEKILAFIGGGILAIMTAFVIIIAKMSSENIAPKNTAISEIFGNKSIAESNIIMSPWFEKISHFEANRVNKSLSFIATASGANIWYPAKIDISAPEKIAKIQTIGTETFITTTDGDLLANREYIGKTALAEQDEDFVFYRDTNGVYQLVSENHKANFMAEWSELGKVIFNEKTLDIFWRANVEGGQAIYKNNKKISETYPGILRYEISENWAIILVAEDHNHTKIVVKDGVVIHTISEDYVRGTLQMNASEVLYAVLNQENNTYSIVINGSKIDRELAEIREIFLEKNSNGFAYFGRMPNENSYCLFTRYKGNICGFIAYMNPSFNASGADVIFAANRSGNWAIYKNSDEFLAANYGGKLDISHDYFFFDATNPRYHIFVEKIADGYIINKQGKKSQKIWQDIDTNSIKFDYDGKIIFVAKDESGWKIVEA